MVQMVTAHELVASAAQPWLSWHKACQHPLRIHSVLLALAGDGLREQVQKIDEALAFSTQSPVDVPEHPPELLHNGTRIGSARGKAEVLKQWSNELLDECAACPSPDVVLVSRPSTSLPGCHASHRSCARVVLVRVEHVHVNDGGQAIIGNVKKADR